MKKLAAFAASAVLTLALTVPLTTAVTPTTPMAVTGSFIGTYTGPGADGNLHGVFRFEVRTDASGAVQFGYYQTEPLGSPSGSTSAIVDNVKFYRDASGARAARLGLTECNVATGQCNGSAVVVVTDGSPDTFCGGDACQFTYSVDDGNIAIFATEGQNRQ